MIGLISDTHGLLREEAVALLQGSDVIIHAGDVGKLEILDALRRLAPVVAVRGNIDHGAWADALPASAFVESGSLRIYVVHTIDDLDLDPVAAGFHVVVSGHSHQPGQFTRSGVLYVNPGSAGPRRFRLPISMARLDARRRPLEAEFFTL